MTSPSLTLPETLQPSGREQAVAYLKSYFAPVTARSGYTGSRFERLGGGGDRPAIADEFTAEDLAALPLLSVTLKGDAVLEVLETRRARLRDLLRQVPTDLELVDVDPQDIDPDWAPWRLEVELRSVDGIGSTKASKFLARKRPRLVPVYDTLVADLLQPQGGFWASVNAALRADNRALYKHLLSLRDESGIGHDISPLRVFDVVAWRTRKDQLAEQARLEG